VLAGVGAGPPNFVGMTPVGALTLWVVLTTACGAGAAACVWKLGFAFMAACTAPGAALQEYTGCFGWSEWFLSIAIVLLSFGFFATASKSTTAAVHVVSGGTRGEKCCGTMSLIVLVVFMAVTSFASMYYLAKPWETYQTDASGVTKDSPEWTIDNWLVFLGSGMFAGAAPFFVALLAVCFNLCRKQPPRFNSQSGEFDEMAAEPRRRDLEHNLIEHKGAAHSKQHTRCFPLGRCSVRWQWLVFVTWPQPLDPLCGIILPTRISCLDRTIHGAIYRSVESDHASPLEIAVAVTTTTARGFRSMLTLTPSFTTQPSLPVWLLPPSPTTLGAAHAHAELWAVRRHRGLKIAYRVCSTSTNRDVQC